MTSRLSSAAARILVALLIAGCAAGGGATGRLSASPTDSGPYVLTVANVDGPDVEIWLNDQYALTVPCSTTATLSPGVNGVPHLPWSIVVRTIDLQVLFGPHVETGHDGTLLIRKEGVLVGAGPARGPAPSPLGDPCAASRRPTPDPSYVWGLGLSNATTLTVTLVVNGTPVGTFPPVSGTPGVGILPSDLPPLPWHVEARAPSGRVLLEMDVTQAPILVPHASGGGAMNRGSGERVDLSCGRLDIWAGPPLLGPLPGPGTPGDCEP